MRLVRLVLMNIIAFHFIPSRSRSSFIIVEPGDSSYVGACGMRVCMSLALDPTALLSLKEAPPAPHRGALGPLVLAIGPQWKNFLK